MWIYVRSLFWVAATLSLASLEVWGNEMGGPPSRSGNVIHERRICQGSTGTIQCGEGEVIYLEQGFYGRTKRNVCTMPGQPSPRHCHPESIGYQLIWESCEGMNTCTLTATDDAMQSTQCLRVNRFMKYIHLQYRCDKPGRKIIGDCTGTWGDWLNTDNPGGIGDLEMVANHRNLKEGCTNPLATEIQLSDGRDYHEGNNVLRLGQKFGVECRTSRQKSGVSCQDYKVRYCCFRRQPIVRCPYPGQIENGIGRPLRSSFRVKQTVVYSCKSNYKVTLPNRLECQDDKTWSAPLPSCVPAVQINRCKAFGDPHYYQFDGTTRYDFMGKCTYMMSEACKLDKSDPRWFSVESVNEERNNLVRVSYVGSVRVKLNGGSTTIMIGKEGMITVNGTSVSEVRTDLYTVTPSGTQTVLKTKHGLRVAYNGNGLTIELDDSYKDEICGICGNFNGDSSDDMTMASGEVAKDFTEYANSYETETCKDSLPKEPVICTPEDRKKWEERCSDLSSGKSVFSECHGAVDPEPYYESCVFDSCATAGSQSNLDQVLTEYAHDCKRFDIKICNWRAKTKASKVSCPPNSSYRPCTSPCTNTCQNPTASLTCKEKPIVEACVCDRGYLYEGGKCVKKSHCGCTTKDGLSIPQGSSIEEKDGYLCKCVQPDQLKCQCKPGYISDGTNCKKIQCLEHSSYNPHASLCTDTCYDRQATKNCKFTETVGLCKCNPGYVIEYFACVKVEDCGCVKDKKYYELGTTLEDKINYKECTCMAGGSFDCKCMEGYVEEHGICNKVTCAHDPCDENADCLDKDDSYMCTCRSGYRGDGKTCREILCIEHSSYNPRASFCTDTCYDRQATKNCKYSGTVGRCKCDPGYVIEYFACVKVEDCGCRRGIKYYELGATLEDEDNHQECTCVTGSTFDCKCMEGYVDEYGICRKV